MDSNQIDEQMKIAIATAVKNKKAEEVRAKLEISQILNSPIGSGGEE